ncbi:RES family NAD+ phosphorylase [Devosia sp. A8/3-2]|nr:RES family NAD+ phosphorylase [Devosia sp. A8/3-2]
MSEQRIAAPRPCYRLIPSQFPPIGLFDTVSTPADLEAVMDPAGWTNDRLVSERLRRLPEAEWAFGRHNSSIIMAAFLHAPPGGTRFAGPDLGARYAAAAINTAVAEVAHHLRRELVARNVPAMTRTYRTYHCRLEGDYLDLREQQAARPELYDGTNYTASQTFGEAERASGGDGLAYDSLRHSGGTNVVAYRPSKVLDVVQGEHLDVSVTADAPTIQVRRLSE